MKQKIVSSDMELYLASNLKKITSSRYLLSLLKRYLDEPDEIERQILATEIMASVENKNSADL